VAGQESSYGECRLRGFIAMIQGMNFSDTFLIPAHLVDYLGHFSA
jgi:hypothetical protein